MKGYRKQGNDRSAHHPPLTSTDLRLIRGSEALSLNTPSSLVKKVWFDIQLHLARRGREGTRELSRSSFIIHKYDDGMEYVCLSYNPKNKNHKNATDPDKENLCGFMFADPGNPVCPVASFRKYISKCLPDATACYLHPRRSPLAVLSDTWFTNHSLWSSGLLANGGLESRQIIYWAPSIGERRKWSSILMGNIPQDDEVPRKLSRAATLSPPASSSFNLSLPADKAGELHHKWQCRTIKRVYTAEFRPYLVFVKPPRLEELRLTRRRAKFLTEEERGPARMFSEEDFEEMIGLADAMEAEHGHMFDKVVVNGDVTTAFRELRVALETASGPDLQWIPAEWIQTSPAKARGSRDHFDCWV
ncbi:MAGUK p55 subfamily member 7 [Merluccius polli]|uniref:MAGUK p55 subfamily member 7 n=1 Tax=Merluccius polli TaxID=89951 RepID=A0AA47MH71_MERPO|nr:MAGUK p55 subfamily member 7 [Merluccius polli]